MAGRSPRRVALIVGAAGLALVAALLGWLSGRSGPVQLASVEAATPAASASPGRVSIVAIIPSWRSIVQSLDRARADAFATGDAQALGNVYTAGSPLLRSDRAAIAGLTATGRRARGVQHRITSVELRSQSDSVVVLRVVDELSSCEIVDASGHVVGRTAPRPAAPFVVRLVRAPAGWRLAEITPG